MFTAIKSNISHKVIYYILFIKSLISLGRVSIMLKSKFNSLFSKLNAFSAGKLHENF